MNDQEKFRVIFTGGGSGGHIYPLVAVAEVLTRRMGELKAPAELIYMGPKDGYSVLLANRGLTMRYIMAGKLRRYGSLENLLDGPKFFFGFIQALFSLYAIMPDVIFSKGGTGALPVVLAGWFYRIPIVIHESDSQPGLTNLASARFARKIFVSFPRAAKFFNPQKTEVSGPPLRMELLEGKTTKELAKEVLGFDPKQPLTVVIGGSQGSVRMNDFVVANLPQFLAVTQVLHQTGIANFLEVQKLSHAALLDSATKNRYQPINYIQNMSVVLTAADVVIGRAGSNILEFAAFGVPSILVPLPGSASDHQRINAYEFAKGGAAVVIEEPNLLPGIFFGQLAGILQKPDVWAKMSAAAIAAFMPGGAEKIVEGIISLGAGR